MNRTKCPICKLEHEGGSIFYVAERVRDDVWGLLEAEAAVTEEDTLGM